ncbi:MAG: DUF1802 family protein [Candidatus Omnitrophica bacterium]|nr:DUF1802 family protein [Candidatus Omnitrophota bacterium]
MPATLPQTCSTALKEWATVVEAMRRGEQILLIRKGGLIEPGSGFELLSDSFVLYPTFEHQAVAFLRTSNLRYFDEAVAKKPPAGSIAFDTVAVSVTSMATRDSGIIQRLSDFHIYNEAFLSQRLKWQPEQPLVVVVVRAFRLPQPYQIPVVPDYAGCKSWVQLQNPVSLEGCTPVLAEEAFQEKLAAVAKIS